MAVTIRPNTAGIGAVTGAVVVIVLGSAVTILRGLEQIEGWRTQEVRTEMWETKAEDTSILIR